MKRIALSMTIVLALALAIVGSAGATVPDLKVVVCKYVGGNAEELQTGQNPIEVAQAAMPAEWDGSTFPFSWTDNQNLSIAIGFEGQGLDITDCPGYEPPPPTATEEPTATEDPTATATLEPDVTPSDTPTASATSENDPTATPKPPRHPPTGPWSPSDPTLAAGLLAGLALIVLAGKRIYHRA